MLFESEDTIFQLTIILMAILCGTWVYRIYSVDNTKKEPFQSSPFILRKNGEIYDEFYVDEYDDLYKSEDYSKDDYKNIITHTKINSDSTILDIGCGTGKLLKQFETNGFDHIFGMDTSKTMVETAQSNLFKGEIVCMNAISDPMMFEKDTFTHILCTHFTIYEIQDKHTLLKYCYSWLRIGGYMAIHIVVPEKYNMITPSSDLFPHLKSFSAPSHRVTQSIIEKEDYKFSSSYEFSGHEWIQHKEMFEKGKLVRQNEKIMYMTDKDTIIDMAQSIGFHIVKEGSYDLIPDKYQSFIIFQKI